MGRDVEAQRAAAIERQGEQLSSKMSAPGEGISRAAGEMERESPLFRGTEASGTLPMFGGEAPSEPQRQAGEGEGRSEGPGELAQGRRARMAGRECQ
jgi:hypothetical protein